jgi:N-acetylmuramoyl-L-alanine amidase
MREIKTLVIHASDTFPEMDIGRDEIVKWHTDPKPKGNGWSKEGYHWYIRRDGSVEQGLDESEPGIHVGRVGRNHDTIGICMIGGKARGKDSPCNFTKMQWATLDRLIALTVARYQCEVVGHYDLDPTKTCPTFDVKAYINAR